ncbi:MAG: hypothetical protein J6B54_06710 [Clostridia bacterium]|nr:hypothetical protein [Clostridia bacterium]
MKKISFLLTLLFLLSCVGCSQENDRRQFEALREAFLERGESVEGYQVSEIASYDGFDFFCVRICLNTDDAATVDDYMWYEAEVMLFSSEAQADEAYRRNEETGVGGTCKQQGKILIYWMSKDPFADLYNEVFQSVFEE